MVGVGNKPGGATTHSLVMRSHSGAIRSITSEHALWKLSAYSAVKYNSPEGIDPETLGCSLAEEMLSRGGGSLLPALALTEPPRHLPAATTGLAS